MSNSLTFEAEPFELRAQGGCGCARCRHHANAPSEEFEWEEESWTSQYAPGVRRAIERGIAEEAESEDVTYDRAKAIRLNRCMREWLSWTEYRQELYTLLGFPRTCPTESALADAVRRWQQEQNLTPDGILGLQTLNTLHARLGRPALTKEPARPSWFRWDPSPNFS